jgi:DNA repair ATPase RecN
MPKLEHLLQDTSVALLELEAAVMRLRDVEIELDESELALKEDQEEIDNYTSDIADCCSRIEAIDKFVRDIHAGNVPDVADKGAMLSEMADEREEEKHSIDKLSEARACHEQQVQQLRIDRSTLQTERLMLHKKISHVLEAETSRPAL